MIVDNKPPRIARTLKSQLSEDAAGTRASQPSVHKHYCTENRGFCLKAVKDVLRRVCSRR